MGRSKAPSLPIKALSFCRPTELRGKGGGASHQRGNAFPTPAGRLYGFPSGKSPVVRFYHKRAPSINLEAPSTTLSGIAAVKLKPLKNLRPERPSTLKPQRGLPFVGPVGTSKKLPDFSGSFLIRIEIPLCPAHGPPAQGR